MVPPSPPSLHSGNAKACLNASIGNEENDVDPMHKSTSPGRKSLRIMALAGTVAAVAAGGALIAGVSPAQAANFASQPDTQVAVFMVPLTLLVLVLLFEVARFVWRGTLPARPVRAPRPTNWSQHRDTP